MRLRRSASDFRAKLCSTASCFLFHRLQEDFPKSDWVYVNGNGAETARTFDDNIGIFPCEYGDLTANDFHLMDSMDFKLVGRRLRGKTQRDTAIVLPHLVQRKIRYKSSMINNANAVCNALYVRNLMG